MENKENRELFEKNLKELEGGDVTLDQMLELFEKGVKLTKQCTAALDAAEQKINILIKNRETGQIEEQPFAGMGEQN